MINSTFKIATALGVIGAIALSVTSAEARAKRKSAAAQNAVIAAPAALPQQNFRGSFNFAPTPSGNYINFNDGRLGANYNPNQ